MSTAWRNSPLAGLVHRLAVAIRAPWRLGLLVALVAGVGLMATHHTERLGLPRGAAIRAAERDATVHRDLRGLGNPSVDVEPVDGHLTRVDFSVSGRIVVSAGVLPSGHVPLLSDYAQQRVPYGDWIAYEPAVIIGLTLLFALVTASLPLFRRENLDVLAAVTLAGSVWLFAKRYIDLSLIMSAPAIAYLAIRSAGIALGGQRGRPGRPLFSVVTPWLDADGRVRALRLLLVALGLIYFMVGVSSPEAVDVTYAVMEGATKLIHGVLPYGHMPGDILHSDTYPLLSYALYTPLAAIDPVNNVWASVDGALAVAVFAALGSAWMVVRMVGGGLAEPSSRRRWRRPRLSPEDEQRSLRAAVALLAFPPLLITVSTGTTDVLMATILMGALVLWRRPGISTALLAVAGWFKLAPFALLPVWLAPLRGRRLVIAVAAVAAVTAPVLIVLLALGGIAGPGQMLSAIGYQFTRGSPQSIWSALGLAALQPLGQAAVLGLIAGAVMKIRSDPELAADRVRMAALSGGILLGLQLAANYWAFLYLAWVIPLLSVSVLGCAQELPEPALAAKVVGARVPYGPNPAT